MDEGAKSPEACGKAAASAMELITHTADACWSKVWPLLRNNKTFAEQVLAGSWAADPSFGFQFTGKLSADEVADFFLWLGPSQVEAAVLEEDDEGLPANVVPRKMSMILGGLSNRGTAEAVRALRRIHAAQPEISELKWHIKTAEELTRWNTWVPLTPPELVQLIENASSRFVRNGSDLLEILTESLKRLEHKLQGVTPAAIYLWNEIGRRTAPGCSKRRPIFRPKDESDLSNYIKTHLEAELHDRGVLVNREVEIRRFTGGAPGERIDIQVEVGVPSPDAGRMEKITVIIEVKGVWNTDVSSAMETQLVGRYLKDTGIGHGLYVVGWYACPQWDPKDYRSRRNPYSTLSAAQAALDAQAMALSDPVRNIRAVVVNAALR